MKHITIELSKQSCSKALKELQKYQKEIKPKMDEVCKRLAQIGADAAQAHISGGFGNSDAAILPIVPIDNGYKIVMQGTDVYFVEFGTGDQVDAHFDVSVPVEWGSWSEEHGRQLLVRGFWFYGGDVLYGTPAEKPMYYAGKAIRENAKRIVREVFGK